MKRLVSLLVVLVASSAMAHREAARINSGSELRDLCKEESEEALIGKGLAPFNWSASYWDQGNVLMSKANGALTARTLPCNAELLGEMRLDSRRCRLRTPSRLYRNAAVAIWTRASRYQGVGNGTPIFEGENLEDAARDGRDAHDSGIPALDAGRAITIV